MKILLVEDEKKIASFVKRGLEEQGYAVDEAQDGKTGKELILQNDYDVALLDLLLPYIGGLELSKLLREKRPNCRIIMLTALGTTEDKLIGFHSGADDYLLKPFEFRELIARIKALTSRASSEILSSGKLSIADLELDLDKKVAIRGKKVIELTAKEFGLLEYLMRNSGRLVSRADISEKVWDINFDTGTNVVDVYINILRKKIDRDFPTKLIHTRIGMGYILKEN